MKLLSFLRSSSPASSSRVGSAKTLIALVLLKLFTTTGCVIEGDKDRPDAGRDIPCGTIYITDPNCKVINPELMLIEFKINQLTNPDLCDEAVAVDLKIDIESTVAQPINYREVTGTNTAGHTINFSSTNPLAQDVTGINEYSFEGNISFTNPLPTNTAPLPEITATTYETTSTAQPGNPLTSDDYQFPCNWEIPCQTQLTAYCHAIPGDPHIGRATYKVNVCNPFTMHTAFTVAGFQLANANIRYTLRDASGNTIYDIFATPGTIVPLSLQAGEYTILVNYCSSQSIPQSGTTTLQTFGPNQILGDFTGSVSDADCTN